MSARVSLVRCPEYAGVAEALPRLLAPLGGMAAFVKPGQTVLIKPNLLSDHAPAEAVTTHPELVRAVIRLVRDCGGRPLVGDSPANVADLGRVWARSGIEALCREEGAPLLNLEKAGSRVVERDGVRFSLAQPVGEADVIVNLPKVKTHVLTHFTGAVKNLYGTIPGMQKTTLHKLYPHPRDFGRVILAAYAAARPALSIADAVVGMEGNGPSGGTPVPLGLLAASADAVALDAVVARLIGLDLARILYLAQAARQGLGEIAPERIEIVGDADVDPPAVRPPDTLPIGWIPAWVFGLVRPFVWHRPVFTARCVFCGQCVRACPATALRLEPRQRPVLTPARCIACCCCHEVCPARAIEMRPSPLLRAVQRLRGSAP